MESNIFRLKNWFFFYKKLTLEIFLFFHWLKKLYKKLEKYYFPVYYILSSSGSVDWKMVQGFRNKIPYFAFFLQLKSNTGICLKHDEHQS